jgi:TPR repeat protein
MTRAVLLVALALGCAPADPAPAARTVPSTTTASTAPPASASAAAPPALARRRTPAEVRRADESACASGTVAACRGMADRYRGYGAPAGCGVDRGRPAPSSKRIAEDTDADAAGFLEYIRRACDLGDAEACELERAVPTLPSLDTATAEDVRVRSSTDGSALWRWMRESRPEHAPLADAARKECFAAERRWQCSGNEGHLYRRSKTHDATPSDAVRRRALAICAATHECTDILMMLDKDGYAVDAVEPLEREMAGVLVEACLDGECVCGDAARHLPDDDARRLALAEAGCDNGEAEGCFELGRLYQEGRGVAVDEARAFSLYELACPQMRPLEEEFGPRQGEYSPRACDRLAAREEHGEMPPKEQARAFFYAHGACQRPGFERDHAPCLRLGRYHAYEKNTGRSIEDAHEASLGRQGDPIYRKECTRPSVAAACRALEDEIGRIPR